MTTSQLAEQAANGLRQLQVRLEPLHDLSAQARDIHRAASGQTQQHIADLLGHIDRHVLLGFLGGGTQVRGQHQATLHSAQW